MMISPEQYIDGLEWRYACKKFDPEARLEQPTWHALAESLRLSPSSLGLQLWKFVVVTNRELKMVHDRCTHPFTQRFAGINSIYPMARRRFDRTN